MKEKELAQVNSANNNQQPNDINVSELNPQEQRQIFLRHLLGDTCWYTELRALPTDPAGERDRRFVRANYDGSSIIKVFSNSYNRGHGIYYVPNTCDGKGGKKENIKELTALFCDFDVQKDHRGDYDKVLGIINSFEYPPSAIVHSGRGLHTYWTFQHRVAADAESAALWQSIQTGLATLMGADLAITDINNPMRLPGTWNVKDPKNPLPCYVVKLDDISYKMEDFTKFVAYRQQHTHRQHVSSLPSIDPGIIDEVAQMLVDMGLASTMENREELTCFCAYHQDGQKPNMNYNTATGLFRCFSCGAAGSAYDLRKQLIEKQLEEVMHKGNLTPLTPELQVKAEEQNARMAAERLAKQEQEVRIKAKSMKKEFKKESKGKRSTDMAPSPEESLAIATKLAELCQYKGPVNIPDGFLYQLDGQDSDLRGGFHSILSVIQRQGDDYKAVELCCPFVITAYIQTSEGTKQVIRTIGGKEVTIDVAMSDPRSLEQQLTSPLLGITLTRAKLLQIIDYINAYQQANKDNIKRIKGVGKTGWEGDAFTIPTQDHPDIKWTEGRLVDSLSLTRHRQDAKQQGEALIRYLMGTPSGITILAALSAPLLRKLRVTNYIVHISGLFLSGKSCSQYIAMSMYGNPNELRYSWNSTAVSRELIASMYRDLPIWVEEFEESRKATREFMEFSYQYVAGQGKARSQKNLLMREAKKYNGVLLSSAEKDLDTLVSSNVGDETKKLGLYRRVIEISAEKESFLFPFNNTVKRTNGEIETMIGSFYKIADGYHGWFGKAWINFLEGHMLEMEGLFDEKTTKVRNTGGLDNAFAVLHTVLHSSFMSAILSGEEIASAEANLGAMAGRQGAKNNEVRDIVTDFLEKTANYLLENSPKVLGLRGHEDKNIGLIGEVIYHEGSLSDCFITSNTFDKICQQYGFSKSILLQQLGKQGHLHRTRADRYIFQHMIMGTRVTGYYIKNAMGQHSAVDSYDYQHHQEGYNPN